MREISKCVVEIVGMRKRQWLSIIGGLCVAVGSANAQRAVGIWRVDVQQSNFGSDPSPVSITYTVTEDTPKTFAYRLRRVNQGDDSPLVGSWSGPKDGSAHRITIVGFPNLVAAEGVKEVNGSLVFHGIEHDGSLEYTRITFSDDRRTMTANITWTHFDGTEDKEKWVFHRDQSSERRSRR